MATRSRKRRYGILVVIAGLCVLGVYWLKQHPEHNPWAPLRLNQPVGWATQGKLVALGRDDAACFGMLDRAAIRYERRPSKGQNQCFADNLARLSPPGPQRITYAPVPPEPSCAVNVTMLLWERNAVQTAAQRHLGQRVVRIDHMGTYNCRTIANSRTQSEHATGNAIDISAFILADGRRVTVLDHWDAPDGRSAFLRAVRDQSCDLFATVLSPDYNAAHANHFHFDQADRTGGWSVCR